MKEDFIGDVVLVTGAASGIGLAQAKAFLQAGAQVFAVDRQAFPEVLVAQVGDNLALFEGDVSQEALCQKAVAACENRFGPVTILLNTAGKLDGYAPLMETSTELWLEILQTNLNSMFYLSKAVLPGMLARKSGTILNMASVASFVAGGGGIAYTTAKHAIAGFTKQLALDYAEQGIHVLALAPRAIQTPMNAADFAGDGAMAKWVAQETPLKRWAQPEEVAEVSLFMASKRASYLQGNVIPIDGGWLLK